MCSAAVELHRLRVGRPAPRSTPAVARTTTAILSEFSNFISAASERFFPPRFGSSGGGPRAKS